MANGIRTKRVPWTDNFEAAEAAVRKTFGLQKPILLKISDGQDTFREILRKKLQTFGEIICDFLKSFGIKYE